jgi:DNA-binding NtrC family response regulator
MNDRVDAASQDQEIRPRPRVLIVDDDEAFAADIAMVVGREAEVRCLVDPDEALVLYRQGWPDAVLLDIEFPAHDGIELLQEMQAGDASIPVVMLTSHTGIPLVVAAMRAGAVNFVAKSQSPPEIVLETVRHALRQSDASRHLSYLQDRLDDIKGTGHTQVLGESAASARLREDLELAARADLDVLLLGETGTGKELAARWIHQNSRRDRGPFVAEDLCSIPETLLASALFGHEKGAFTGAVSRRVGAFEAARAGTLMLDEIGEIPLPMQSSLLRVLQNREIHRLGADPSTSVACDVRVIAATHQDLEAMVAVGDFRDDLYYRLKVLTVRMPPLRERREDIPPLVRHFVEKHQVATGSPVETVDDAAMDLLQRHDWPGNIRDLENTLQEALIRSRGRVLERNLVERILGGRGEEAPAPAVGDEEVFPTYHAARQRTMTRWQRAYLLEALRRADNVVNQAARLVDISPNSFRNMMRKLGIARQGDTSR